jgi:hypothetical protein
MLSEKKKKVGLKNYYRKKKKLAEKILQKKKSWSK